MKLSRKFYAMTAALMLAPLIAYGSVTVTVNGSNHTIPQTNEKGWGTNVTAWIQSISANTLQPSGGTFTLTADTNFGANFGLVSTYYKSRSSDISTAGIVRLANTDSVGWRNFANGGNLLLSVDSSDRLTFNGVIIPTATSASVQDSTFTIYDNSDTTKKIAFQASGIGTGATRTITMPNSDVDLGGLVNANVASAAAIDATKIADGSVTSAEFQFINTLSSNAQTQLNAKPNTATLSDNRLIRGDGTAAIQASGITVSDADVVSGATIDADDNTLQDIANASIKASAGIALDKLAAITADRVMVSNGSGFPSASSITATTLSYLDPTSSVQTQLDAKQARSTLTTKGDIYVATASATVARQAIGTDGQVLTADSAQTNGLKWATPATAPDQSYEISNCSLATSVASSALTIALKDKSGSDPSAGSPCKVGFRNATLATGTYSQVSVTAATSLVISSGSTLGHTSAVAGPIYVYLLNNAGTVELAASSALYQEGGLATSTAEGGAGAADTYTAVYSTTARTGVAFRTGWKLTSTQATAGTWASNVSSIESLPFEKGSVISTNTVAERLEHVRVAPNCSASPCTMLTATPGISSVTRGGTGAYTINFVTAAFSSAPVCVVSPDWTGGYTFAHVRSPSAATVLVDLSNTANAAADSGFTLICMGTR